MNCVTLAGGRDDAAGSARRRVGRVVPSTGRDSPSRPPRRISPRFSGKVGRRPHSVDASTTATNVDDARGGRGRGESERERGGRRGAFVDRFDRRAREAREARATVEEEEEARDGGFDSFVRWREVDAREGRGTTRRELRGVREA